MRPAVASVQPGEIPSPVGAQALRMAVDPETGDLVPVRNAVDLKGPQAMNRSQDGLVDLVIA